MGILTSFLSKLGLIDTRQSYTIVFLDTDRMDPVVADPHDLYTDSGRLSLEISMLTPIGVLQDYIREHFPYSYPHAFKINNSEKFSLNQLMLVPKDTNLLAHLRKYRYKPYADSPSEINMQISTCTMDDLDRFGIDKSAVVRQYQRSAPILGTGAETRSFRRMLLLWTKVELEKRAECDQQPLPSLTTKASRFAIEEVRKDTRSRRTI